MPKSGLHGLMSGAGRRVGLSRAASGRAADCASSRSRPRREGRAISRIVAPGEGGGPVSLGRMDTDIVVTEYGAADLRGLDHHERAGR